MRNLCVLGKSVTFAVEKGWRGTESSLFFYNYNV